MPIEVILSEAQLKRLRFLIKQDLNGEAGGVKLSHVREALAYAAGFTTDAARMAMGDPVLRLDHYRFCERLNQFGYTGYAGFNLDEHVRKVLT